jgi:hypothetical protein
MVFWTRNHSRLQRQIYQGQSIPLRTTIVPGHRIRLIFSSSLYPAEQDEEHKTSSSLKLVYLCVGILLLYKTMGSIRFRSKTFIYLLKYATIDSPIVWAAQGNGRAFFSQTPNSLDASRPAPLQMVARAFRRMTAPSPPSQSIGSHVVHPPSEYQVRRAAGSEAVRQAPIHVCESVDQTWKRRFLARSYAWIFRGVIDCRRRNIQILKHEGARSSAR